MSSDVEIFRRLRALEAEVRRLKAMEYAPRTGTWTPALEGTTGTGTLTYSAQEGYYERIGVVVIARWYLVLNAISVAPTGDLRIAGLPFTIANALGQFGYGGMAFNDLNLTAGCIDVQPRAATNTDEVYFLQNFDNAGASFLPASALAATSVLTGQVIYRATA
jgi:hypothetical protein